MHFLGAQHVEHAAAYVNIFLRHAQLGTRTNRYGIGAKAPTVKLHQLPDLLAQVIRPKRSTSSDCFMATSFLLCALWEDAGFV